jgi:hypothetical protein
MIVYKKMLRYLVGIQVMGRGYGHCTPDPKPAPSAGHCTPAPKPAGGAGHCS